MLRFGIIAHVILVALAVLVFGSSSDSPEVEKNKDTSFEITDQPRVPDSSFIVFNGMRFRKDPYMPQFGFKPIDVIYANRLWEEDWENVQKDISNLPSKELVTKWANRAKKIGRKYIVFDIEHWPTRGEPEVLQKSIENYIRVVDWFKEVQPTIKVGYWGTMPIKKRYINSPIDSAYYKQWQQNNDRLAPLAEKVDAFFPHLYTYSDNRDQWVRNAKHTIKEARRYSEDKPVFVFLWPQYYDEDNRGGDMEYIEGDYWQLQLETARKYADGIVIWFPYRTEWEEASKKPWWDITKEFLRKMDKHKENKS